MNEADIRCLSSAIDELSINNGSILSAVDLDNVEARRKGSLDRSNPRLFECFNVPLSHLFRIS